MKRRDPNNAAGDFYVAANECIRCFAPHQVAPGLMNDAGVSFQNCFFRRQPRTDAELEQAIAAVRASCVHALRYSGTDRRVIKTLHDEGCGECCDHPAQEDG